MLVEALRDVIDESITNLAKGLVTREEGEKHNYTQKVQYTIQCLLPAMRY